MKIRLGLYIIVLSFMSRDLYACDAGGCGASTALNGAMPDFENRVLGFRYRYSNMQTHLGPNQQATYLTKKERYAILEAWFSWNFGKRLSIMGSIPYTLMQQKDALGTSNQSGLGDIVLQGFYKVGALSQELSLQKSLRHNIWIGAGIKLPTGKYHPNAERMTADANYYQLGTGSTDFLFSALYDGQLDSWGLNISLTYKMNTTNKDGYWYGHRGNMSASLYYQLRMAEGISIVPSVGALWDVYGSDLDAGLPVHASGGRTLFGNIGARIRLLRLQGAAFYQPIMHSNMAAGTAQPADKWVIQLGWTF
jgi:hypothetical protein